MKICILTPRFPMPENGGDVLRINNIARYLKSQGHELVLVSYYDEKPNTEQARTIYNRIYTIRRKPLNSFFYALFFMLTRRPIQAGYYYSPGFLKLFRQVVNKEQPQLFIAHLARMASFLEKAHLEDRSIIEMTDALSKTYALSAGAKGSWLKRLIYSIEKTLIKQHECHIVNRFPKVVLVSQADIDYLRQNANGNGASLHLHTNGVVCQPNPHTTYNPNKICFVGNMRTLQNQDAVLHFVNNIFPIILKQQPHARFYIVGAQPPRHIQELDNQQNVFVTGFVDNLAAAIGDSCIAVAPVNVAAGIQNKVLVAMGTRLPVVLTPLIAQAIPELQDGENCLIRNEARDFAQACLQLMTNSNLRQSMAREGYNMVSHHYSWNSLLAGYEEFH